ncbi:MAG: TetR/AcrR family transcriptional regulator [Geitlerinemataceae cyanobacterium]
MSKADETRQKIIEQAAVLFNQKGYFGTSMSDVMRATGLGKGGIYNHFQSKDELAIEAFNFAYHCVLDRINAAIAKADSATDKLKALVSVFFEYSDNPPIEGGCPLLNTAVDSDDAHPGLHDRAQHAVNSCRRMVRTMVEEGIANQEISSTVEPDCVATILISTIEGAVMMTRLYGDGIHLKRAVAHLQEYIDRL